MTLYYIESDFIMIERPNFQYVPSNSRDRCNWSQNLQDVQLFRRFNHIRNGTDPLKDYEVFEQDFRALVSKMIAAPGSWNFKVVPTVHDCFGEIDLGKTRFCASEIATLYGKDSEGLWTKCQILFFLQKKSLKNLYSDFATRSFIRRWKTHPAPP